LVWWLKLFVVAGCSMGVGKNGTADPLAARLAAGDPSAPEELVHRHYVELYRYAAFLLGPGEAEDAVQECFARAFVALGRYSEGRIRALALRPWLYRILLNVSRNHRRDGRREIAVAEMPERGDGWCGPAREEVMDVLDALASLPERQRTAVTLRYLQGLSYAELSETTGWPVNTCKTLVRRGKTRLATRLSSEV